MYVCTYVRMYVRTYVYMYLFMYICMYIYIYIYTHIYIYILYTSQREGERERERSPGTVYVAIAVVVREAIASELDSRSADAPTSVASPKAIVARSSWRSQACRTYVYLVVFLVEIN